MRYRDGPLVLKNFSASIKGTEKIGIAGRTGIKAKFGFKIRVIFATGSGKSSLMVALFRITPLASGSIFIDGIDISTIPLTVLRSKLGIIPQVYNLFKHFHFRACNAPTIRR